MAKKAKKQTKEKGPLRIPTSFTILGESWKVEHKWSLKDQSGRETPAVIDTIDKVITLDRSLSVEDKPSVFMTALLSAFLSRSMGVSETTNALSSELADFFTETFNLRWRRDA